VYFISVACALTKTPEHLEQMMVSMATYLFEGLNARTRRCSHVKFHQEWREAE
jgi:hypothetical protein